MVVCNRVVLLGQVLLQAKNFILNCVRFFAELPAFGCKICLAQYEILALSLKQPPAEQL
jgi:hypothetical protein